MSVGRRAATLLLVVGALVLVGVAAAARTDAGSGGSRRPSEWLLDALVSMILVQLVIGSVLLVVLVVLRPQELIETKVGAPGRRGKAALALLVPLLALLAFFVVRRLVSSGADGLVPGILGGGAADGPLAAAEGRYEPEFAPIPVLVVSGLIAVAVCAWLLGARSRRAADDGHEALQAALLAALDEGIDDLEAEPDPRRAVIAAYARLEQVLAAHGAARRPAEAPDEYLHRVLTSLELGRPAATRLTALFQAAKFSDHTVDATMKADAIRAFVAARDELRAAREREELARSAAVERAAGAQVT